MSAVLLATLLLNTESVSLQNRLFCDKHLYFEEQLQCHRFNLKYYGQIYCEGVSQQMRDDYPDLVICISSCLAIVTKQYIDGYPKFPYTLYRCNQLARVTKDSFPDCYEKCAFCTMPLSDRESYFDESEGLELLCQ
ncbi:hypothetical protein QR680_010174 [Steinernema hermaphroditum]|uniref:Uncharacterized protein n=1 Tax=Steinernema hermaphroditum TaxID=289476 RepID=A0AA39MB89_9BILA|nr:hypothetical protein QR680_010174 [Steinernema hermaphroditum]